MSISRIGIILFSIAIISVAFVLGVYFFKFNITLSNKQEIWGVFGDFFGGTLNPILGFTSLCALLMTMVLQSKELSNSSSALEKQGNFIQLQAYESTFFSLLNTYNNRIGSLKLMDGNDFSEKLYELYKASYEGSKARMDEVDEVVIIKNSYERFFNKNSKSVSPMIMLLRQLVVYAQRNNNDSSSISYVNIVASSVSDYEILLLMYYLIYVDDRLTLRGFVNIGLFDNIDKERLLNKDSHMSLLYSDNV